MSKKAISYLVFFGLLLGGFYYAMIKYTDFEEVKLPVLNTVQPFEFLRQDSAMASQKDIRNRIYVAEYFFTTCKGICPKMNKNMKAIYEQFKTDSNFLIVSHTVNPDTDSLPVLRHYADSLGADVSNWWFLTGSKDKLYKTARESYLLDDPRTAPKTLRSSFCTPSFLPSLTDRAACVGSMMASKKKRWTNW